MEIPDNKPLFSLSIASKISGIPTKTLNYFEHMRLISPFKTPGNRRLFSKKHLQRILTIQYLKEKAGLNSAGIKLVTEIIDFANGKGINIKEKFFKDLNEEEMLQKKLHQ